MLVLTEQASGDPRSPEAEELRRLLSEVDLDTAMKLARAFSMGFHVGNVTSPSVPGSFMQTHRIRRTAASVLPPPLPEMK